MKRIEGTKNNSSNISKELVRTLSGREVSLFVHFASHGIIRIQCLKGFVIFSYVDIIPSISYEPPNLKPYTNTESKDVCSVYFNDYFITSYLTNETSQPYQKTKQNETKTVI